MSSFHHRSLFGKQKRFKGKSKGKLKRQNKGKVDDDERGGVKARNLRDAGSRKQKLRNISRQMQKERRNEIMRVKRIGGRGCPPRVIAFLPISKSANVKAIREEILRRAEKVSWFNEQKRQYKIRIKIDGREFDFIVYDPAREAISVLDAAKAADVIVPVVSCAGAEGFDVDSYGDHLVTLMKSQALPSIIGAITIDEEKSRKKTKAVNAGLKLCKRWFTSVFDSPRVVTLNSSKQMEALLRHAATIKLSEITWRSPRPYLIAESLAFVPNNNNQQLGTLRVSGLSARQLVHITGYDDFQIAKIINIPSEDAHRKKKIAKAKGKKNTAAPAAAEGSMEVVDIENEKEDQKTEGAVIASSSTAEEREPLVSLNPINSAQENIITEEELKANEEDDNAGQATVPEGMDGVIEDVWRSIVSDDEDDDNEDPLQRIRDSAGRKGKGGAESTMTMDDLHTGARLERDLKHAEDQEDATLAKLRATMNAEKEAKEQTLEDLQNLEKEETEFPDEVELHPDTVAKTRYAKYRGLRSFRKSEWDNRQMLPVEYGHIYQDCKSSKFKTDRYFRTGVWTFASIYCRMLVTSSTVLMFRAHKLPPASSDESGGENLNNNNNNNNTAVKIGYPATDVLGPLVASGTLASVDPDRLLIKRIILTGAPISVSKRQAVVRHMFFRPEDVRWFKPVELWTKTGLIGHIQGAHGTKGYMKCTFDGHIKNHDTVCMSLYKRQYPPFDPRDFGEMPETFNGTAGY
eukprot:jgi/Bigna1/125976/aug1.1_g684